MGVYWLNNHGEKAQQKRSAEQLKLKLYTFISNIDCYTLLLELHQTTKEKKNLISV